jgi:hypothetical protein
MILLKGWRSPVQRCWTVLLGVIVICGFTAMASIAAPSDEGIGEPGAEEPLLIPPGTNPELAPGDSFPSGDEATPDEETAAPEASGPLPAIEYDPNKLPPPVKRIREQILQAAETGDVEKLRPIFEANQELPQLGLSENDDPVVQLKSMSGDPDGREILAILIEVLDAGYVHVDAGTPEEMYVWPYFARYPLDKLDGPQMVELFKLLTAGDYEDMKIYGTYLFYRVGIAPNGVWKYFVTGD